MNNANVARFCTAMLFPVLAANAGVPLAHCRKNDKTESGLQGEVTAAEVASGKNKVGFNCNVDMVGRADPRGTTEYNMALSDRRAQAVKDYLERLGVAGGRLNKIPRGALDATGTEEAGWAKDRRVDFDWK